MSELTSGHGSDVSTSPLLFVLRLRITFAIRSLPQFLESEGNYTGTVSASEACYIRVDDPQLGLNCSIQLLFNPELHKRII